MNCLDHPQLALQTRKNVAISALLQSDVFHCLEIIGMKRPANSSLPVVKRPAMTIIVPQYVHIPGCSPYVLTMERPKYPIRVGAHCFEGVDFSIRRLSQSNRPRSGRSLWGAARCLQPKEASGTPGRFDLEVQLCCDYVRFWTSYHRLVGMTLLQCWHDSNGNLLERGYTVPPDRWGDYHIHHRNSNTFDVSLSNLVIVDRFKLHPLLTAGMVLPEPPVGWGFSSFIRGGGRVMTSRRVPD